MPAGWRRSGWSRSGFRAESLVRVFEKGFFMRHVSEAIASALAAGAAKLCHVWIVTRRDGAVQGFSDHDRPLNLLGVDCAPDAAWTAGAARSELGLDREESSAVAGVLDDGGLSAADIRAGLYDGAEVSAYVVDWSDPAQHVLTGRGTLDRIEAHGTSEWGDGAFVAHVAGPAEALKRVIGRRYGSLCDAELGDVRCGLEVASLPAPVCDKRYRTCLETFHNVENFRGFPDLPGGDFLTLYPREGEVMDGGARGLGSGR